MGSVDEQPWVLTLCHTLSISVTHGSSQLWNTVAEIWAVVRALRLLLWSSTLRSVCVVHERAHAWPWCSEIVYLKTVEGSGRLETS